jgi:hypothetical protein
MAIHLIDGEKGGVGKSWIAYCLSEFLLARFIKFSLLAADRSNPTATSKFEDKVKYAKLYDEIIGYIAFSEKESRIDDPDILLDLALERTVVIDLPAQVQAPLTNWIEQKDIFGVSKQSKIEWVRWFICNGRKESIDLLQNSAEFYKDQKTIIVRNQGMCDNWDLFDKRLNPKRKQGDVKVEQTFLEKYNMTTIDFPKLSDGKSILIDSNNWRFEEAIEFGELGLVGKSDIYRYIQSVFEKFQSTGLFGE